MTTSINLSVLLSAYACEPGKGSEPGVGWAWARELSATANLSVITRANNRSTIDACQEDWIQNVHWIYFDLPAWAMFWKRGSRGANLYYWLWQVCAYFKIKPIHEKHKFDVIHHVTFGRYWVPSWLGLLNAKFVFGPVGGGEDTPTGLSANLGFRATLIDFFRNTARSLASHSPILCKTIRKPDALVLAATEETRQKLLPLKPTRIEILPQCGLDEAQLHFFANLPPPSPNKELGATNQEPRTKNSREAAFRIISIGRLVHWKGYHLGIQAFAKLLKHRPDAEYWLINDGPERSNLQNLAAQLGIADKVTFWGKLTTLDEVYEKLGQSDVLLHPALHEAFGNVCLEAMAAGRPVVCLNRGGPALQITPDVGLAVEPGTEQTTIDNLANALSRLAENPEQFHRLSNNARSRAAAVFSWESHVAKTLTIYKTIPENSKTLKS